MATLQARKHRLGILSGLSLQTVPEDERLDDEQHESEQQPDGDHGMHPPEGRRFETAPKDQPPGHVEPRYTDDEHAYARLPGESPLEDGKDPVGIRSELASSNRRQHHGGDHRDAADPDHHRDDVQSTHQNYVAHRLKPQSG